MVFYTFYTVDFYMVVSLWWGWILLGFYSFLCGLFLNFCLLYNSSFYTSYTVGFNLVGFFDMVDFSESSFFTPVFITVALLLWLVLIQ